VRAPSRRSLARRKSAAHIDVQGTPAMLLKQRNMDPCMRQAMRHARASRGRMRHISRSELRERGDNIKPCIQANTTMSDAGIDPALSPPRAFVYC
jgi:hypothetical protein